jgi:hypothetical protein
MTKKIFLFGITLLFFTTSCSKYEFGPAFSLVSRTDRITNSWQYANVFRNGLDITLGENSLDQIYSNSSIGLAIDGRFSYVDDFRDSVTIQGDGNWEFIENDEKLLLIYDDGTRRTLRITRLERAFLWLEEDIGGNNSLTFQLVENE